MAKDDNTDIEGGAAASVFDKPKPDYEKDPNVQARKRAAKRSSNRNSGKAVDDGINVGVPAEVPAQEGGVVAEAEQELADAKTETSENETVVEQSEEAPKAEEEVPAEEAPKAEEEVPAEEAPKAEEEVPTEESIEEPEEYQAPEGESHADLVHRYHEALAYGDIEQADELYMRLQDHRYVENKFRAHKEAIDEAEAREHLMVAKELAAKHPELNEDGIAADKVLALAEIHRQAGLKPAAALRQAVADLYPEQSTSLSSPEVPPAAESAVEAEESPSSDAEAGSPIADMEERSVKKRAIAEVPTASARNESAPPPEKPTRSNAIAQLKAARGQR